MRAIKEMFTPSPRKPGRVKITKLLDSALPGTPIEEASSLSFYENLRERAIKIDPSLKKSFFGAPSKPVVESPATIRAFRLAHLETLIEKYDGNTAAAVAEFHEKYISKDLLSPEDIELFAGISDIRPKGVASSSRNVNADTAAVEISPPPPPPDVGIPDDAVGTSAAPKVAPGNAVDDVLFGTPIEPDNAFTTPTKGAEGAPDGSATSAYKTYLADGESLPAWSNIPLDVDDPLLSTGQRLNEPLSRRVAQGARNTARNIQQGARNAAQGARTGVQNAAQSARTGVQNAAQGARTAANRGVAAVGGVARRGGAAISDGLVKIGEKSTAAQAAARGALVSKFGEETVIEAGKNMGYAAGKGITASSVAELPGTALGVLTSGVGAGIISGVLAAGEAVSAGREKNAREGITGAEAVADNALRAGLVGTGAGLGTYGGAVAGAGLATLAAAACGPAAPICAAVAGIGTAIAGGLAGGAIGSAAAEGIVDATHGARDPQFAASTDEANELAGFATETAAQMVATSSDVNSANVGADGNGIGGGTSSVNHAMTQAAPGPRGDYFLNNQTVDRASDSMRDNYEFAEPSDVMPRSQKQLESDIQFDMFDNVLPGYGNGPVNKLFIQQEARQEKIIEQGPLASPGQWPGPTNGVVPSVWQMQRVIPDKLILKHGAEKTERKQKATAAADSYKTSSLSLLGSDVGYPHVLSSKGLKRKKESPFEPAIRLDFNWMNREMPTGAALNAKRFRLQTDAQRNPEDLTSSTKLMGGPTLSKRRGLLEVTHLQ